jgi:hypothetical protein
MNKAVYTTMAAAISLIVAGSPITAHASQPAAMNAVEDIYDAAGVLEDVGINGILGESEPVEGAVVTSTAGSHGSDDTSPSLEVGLRLNALSAEERSVGDETQEGTLSPDVAIAVPFATSEVSTDGLTEVWRSATSENQALYVDPVPSGVAFYTVVGDADAQSEFTYTYDVPADATFIQDDRRIALFGDGGAALGAIQTPWARDANGADVPVEYSWDAGTLTQKFDVSEASAFPLVAQSGWSYQQSWPLWSKTVAQNRTNLYNCFNCLFPVGGAPRQFPSYGQHLPLTVNMGLPGVNANFACTMADHYWQNSTNPRNQYFGWYFRSAAGHVDGLGSTINFSINPAWDQGSSGTYSQLVVDGWVVNDNPLGIGQPAYVAGAYLNWQNFAFNLRAGRKVAG